MISTESYNDHVAVTSKLEENELNIAYMNALKILEKLYRSLINLYMIDIDRNMIRKLYSYLNK